MRLGTKFHRIENYITGESNFNIVRPGGTGLGLYVVYALVEMMGGKIWDLHGKSMNAVKDYFIAKIKHYQSLGNTVDEMIVKENGTAVKQTPTPEPTATPQPKPTATATVNEYTEFGTFTATETIYFRNEPNLNGKTQGMYYKGDAVNYDRVRIAVNGFVWISWISASTVLGAGCRLVRRLS